MSRRFLLTFALAFSVILGVVAPAAAAPAAQASDGALVRLVHGIPDAPAVDVLIDGQLAAYQLSFTAYTDYLQLAAGDHNVVVQAAGQPVAEVPLTVSAGQAITVILTGTAAEPQALTFEDDLSPLVPGNTRLNAIHAAPEAGAVDVVLPDGSPVLQGLEFGASSGGIDIPANVYPLAVVPAGGQVDEALIPPTEFKLQAGVLYRVAVVSGPTPIVLRSAVQPSDNSVLVRVAHGIPGAPAVDVYAGETLLVPGLEAQTLTEHFAVPLGTYDLSLQPAGESDVAPIATLSADLSSDDLTGQARTLAAVMVNDAPAIESYADAIDPLDPATARIAIVNAIAGSELTAVLDGSQAAVPANTTYLTEVPAGAYSALVTTDSGAAASVDALFNGGTYYTLLVAGSADAPAILLGRNALNMQPGSAATLPAAEAAAPTEEAAPAEEAEPVVTEAPAPTAAPQAVPAGTGIIGLVYNLNPGANLQIRQYPRADALSLGLVPGGTVLSVLGRAGEPDFENLPAGDIDPLNTWLRVIYNTPEGGAVEGWALAQFVQATEDGRPVRLVDLELLASDIPGSAAGPAAAAPTAAPVDAEFFALVYNLNPDANLNLRRTPDTLSEVLAQLPPGTIIEPTAILEDYSWTFVTFRPEGGGEVTGWVATEFVQFVFRGQNYWPTPDRIDELVQRSLLTLADGTRRGEISGGAGGEVGSSTSTAEFFGLVYNLNPDANLNMRRTPDTLAEVLAQLPAGTIIEPTAILEDYSWTFATFRPEGGGEVTGWVSTEFVQFVFRGQNYFPVEDKIVELIQRNLLRLDTGALVGEISAEAAASGQTGSDMSAFRNQYVGTIVLDPGANLHLRRTPNATSESLALIPSGANMLVVGRTANAEWLQVEYDSTPGWVASTFVDLTMNGRRVRLEDVPAVQ